MACLAISLGACGTEKPKSTAAPSAYRADILLAAKATKSDYQRKFLSDGEITKIEYEQAVARTIACVADKGFVLGKITQPGGYYTFSMESSSAGDQAYLDCQRQYSDDVGMYFYEQTTNPQKRDRYEIEVECYKRKKIAPPDYTAAQLKRDEKVMFKNSPVTSESPERIACSANPSLP